MAVDEGQNEEVDASAEPAARSQARAKTVRRCTTSVLVADDADAVPESAAPQDTFRRFELTACALLSDSAHLRTALGSGKRLAQAAPARGSRGHVTSLTPLEAACQVGRFSNVKLLLKEAAAGGSGVTDDAVEESRSRAVGLAADAGADDVVRLLIRSRIQVNASTPGERSPLHTAVRDGHVEIVEALCGCPDTDVNARDARGATALHEAVCRGSSHLLACLLERRANPAVADSRGWTPMHFAAHFGNVDAMARLLDAGSPINGDASSQQGHVAGATGAASEAPGGAIAVAGDAGGTREGGNSPEVWSGAEADPKDGDKPRTPRLPAAGWTPLHLLLARGSQEAAVRQFIAWGADACRPGGQDGLTPLMLAISLGQEAVALILIGLHPVAERVDDQDRKGRSALHFAVAARSEPIVRGLLEVHANPGLRSNAGLTSIDVARSAGLPESSAVVKRLQVEEIARLVMLRQRCRAQNKYEESELVRGDLRLRGVSLDIQNEKWSLPDGTWGYLSTDRSRAQAQGGPGLRSSGQQ